MLTMTYVALTIFLAGNLYRIVRAARTPAHLRWELYPIPRGSSERHRRRGSSYFEESEWWTKPHRTNVLAELRLIAGEVLLQKTVWKHNRVLWPWTWLMHIGLFGTLIAISCAIGSFAGKTSAGELALFVATVAMIAGLVGSTGLIALRVFGSKWRPYTSSAAFVNLLVLVSFFASGAAVLFQSAGGTFIGFAGALLRLNSAPPLSHIASLHVATASLFLAYFPFTHMTHAYMKFFAFHRVRWDDRPTGQDRQMQVQIAANLQRPITWSAPHIGQSRWVDVVDSIGGHPNG